MIDHGDGDDNGDDDGDDDHLYLQARDDQPGREAHR